MISISNLIIATIKISIFNYSNNKNKYNSLFNIFRLFEMSLFQIKQLLSNGEFISQLFLHNYFQRKKILNEYYKDNEFEQKMNIFINKDLFVSETDYKLYSQKGNIEPLIINTILSRKNCRAIDNKYNIIEKKLHKS